MSEICQKLAEHPWSSCLPSLSLSFPTCSARALAQMASRGSPRCQCFSFFLSFFFLLGPHLWHIEGPRPGVQSELRLPAYTTATATPDPSRIFDLHHRSRRCRILNRLSKAPGIELVTSWFLVRFAFPAPGRELRIREILVWTVHYVIPSTYC